MAGATGVSCRTEDQKRSAFWCLLLVFLTLRARFSACNRVATATEQLTADEIGKPEPEICEEGSSSFRALTGVLPTLAGSPTRDMTPERIALIDQYEARTGIYLAYYAMTGSQEAALQAKISTLSDDNAGEIAFSSTSQKPVSLSGVRRIRQSSVSSTQVLLAGCQHLRASTCG
jgi:hypothetical protein